MKQLQELFASNTDSSFMYIRFTYKELGSGEAYFKEQVIALKKNWPAIRREILLEWAVSADNSPFTKQELDTVKALIREPITQICLGGHFFMDIYKQMAMEHINWPPLVGVDVAGGYSKDSSAITVVDSRTTETVGCLNCNYISIPDLAKVLYELVTRYMPNAIINIERTGGWGASVIAQLVKTKIKRNLYWEIKDKVVEERFNGMTLQKSTRKVKQYGYDETRANRDLLMSILRDRMDNHKAKFISPIIYNELCTLEVKKNGRIEHTDNAHDDQIFSYLLALYIWYEGKDLMERYGLQKGTVKTDDDLESDMGIEEKYTSIGNEMGNEENPISQELEEFFNSDKTRLYAQWLIEQQKENAMADEILKNDPRTRKAWAKHNFMSEEDIGGPNVLYTIPDNVFTMDEAEVKVNRLQQEFNAIRDIR